ncbi:hypothetical protein OC834_006533 [Tilletia horrida]|nr:hypothetical protein OC834_006533 [Tilletia horrida]
MPSNSSAAPRTRSARANKPQPGSSRANPVLLSQSTASQATTASDSTTTSSHKQDSQEDDEDYDPAVGTPHLRSQGPTIGEELEELLNDANAADTDMYDHEGGSTSVPANPQAPEDEGMEEGTGEPTANTPPKAATGTAALAGEELPSDSEDGDYAPEASTANTSATDGCGAPSGTHNHQRGPTRTEDDDLAEYERSDDGHASGAGWQDEDDEGPEDQGDNVGSEGNYPPAEHTDTSSADATDASSGDASQSHNVQLYGGEVEAPLIIRAPNADAITYAEVRDAAFGHGDRARVALAPLVISYHIKHGFNYGNPNDLLRLRKDVRNLFLKKGCRAAPFAYNPPITSGRRAIHLLFSSAADFKLALDKRMAIWWRNKRVEIDDHGPCIPHNARLVTFQAPPQEEPGDVLEEIEGQLHSQARLTHLWAHATSPENDPALVERTGWMLAIIELVEADGSSIDAPLGATAITFLPRGDADDIHRTANCTYVYCNSCRTRHPDNVCPKRRKLNPRKVDPVPAEPVRFEQPAHEYSPTPTRQAATSASRAPPIEDGAVAPEIEVIPGRPISSAGRASTLPGTLGPSGETSTRTTPAHQAQRPHGLPAKPPAPATSAPPLVGTSWKPSSGPNAEPVGSGGSRRKVPATSRLPADAGRNAAPPRSPKGKGREQGQAPIDFFFSPGRIADISRAHGPR